MRRQYYVKSSLSSRDSEIAGHKAAATKKEHDSSSKVPDPFESERERDDALHNIRSYLWLKDFESNVKQGEGYFPFDDSDVSSGEDDWKFLAKVNLKNFFSVSDSDEIEANQNPKPKPPLTTASRGSGLKQMTGLSSKEISRVKNSSPDSVTQIEKVEKEGSVLTKAAENVSDHFSEYTDKVNYGDMYHCLLESLEKYCETNSPEYQCSKESKTGSDESDTVEVSLRYKIAQAVYGNEAPVLQLRMSPEVNDDRENQEVKAKGTEAKESDSCVGKLENHYRPKKQEQNTTRFRKNLGGELLYQRQTNIPVCVASLQDYFGIEDAPKLLRMGMQVQKYTSIPFSVFFEYAYTINPLFDAYLEGLGGKKHCYFNFLDNNKTAEKVKIEALKAKSKNNKEIILVTLPSTQGRLGKEAPSDGEMRLIEDFKSELKEILSDHQCPKMNFDITGLDEGLRKQFLPDMLAKGTQKGDSQQGQVKSVSFNSEETSSKTGPSYDDLIAQSVAFIVGDAVTIVISQAQRQAIMFHLFSYALPKAILNFYDNEIESMNFTCKSGIDRGWKAQLYFLIAEYVHVQASLEVNVDDSTDRCAISHTILSFIEDYLDAAANAARGRPMNRWNREVFFNVIEAMATSGKLGELLVAGDEDEDEQSKIRSNFLSELRRLRNTKNLCAHKSSKPEAHKPETSSCTIM